LDKLSVSLFSLSKENKMKAPDKLITKEIPPHTPKAIPVPNHFVPSIILSFLAGRKAMLPERSLHTLANAPTIQGLLQPCEGL
jgi:hypothetical protein